MTFVAPPDREARLEFRTPALTAQQPNQFAKLGGVDNVIGRLQASLDQVESRQIAALAAAEEIDGFEGSSHARRDLGPRARIWQTRSRTPRAPMGGPFVPVKLPSSADPFERQLYRIHVTRAQMDKLNRTMALVPYRKPVVGEVEFTSGFGVRSDPFLGRPAMHTGLDFRGATGDPIRATANGRSSRAAMPAATAAWSRSTMATACRPATAICPRSTSRSAMIIKIGQVIGLVGSTGRSTGPHLHYETRIDGEAVDPQKFLRAGVRLNAG